jgi:hypothetical protein
MSAIPDTEMTYDEQIKEMTVTKSLKLLRDGFKNELATALYSDERTTELFAQLISEFVETNIPVVDDENQMELSMMLLETLDIVAR